MGYYELGKKVADFDRNLQKADETMLKNKHEYFVSKIKSHKIYRINNYIVQYSMNPTLLYKKIAKIYKKLLVK